MDLKGKKFTVLGAARSGIAAARKIVALGGEVFISEINSGFPDEDKIKQEFSAEFGGHSERIFDARTFIVSPGIPFTAPVMKEAFRREINLISEIEFGFSIVHPQSKIIAITGSNGKSTTVSLLAHILEGAGKKVLLAGNIGNAFTGFPIETPAYDFIVLEISSFQLDLCHSFAPHVAAVLNITPDHLNRYPDFDAYAHSKWSIFKNIDENGLAIVNADDPVSQKMPSLPCPALSFSLEKKTDAFFVKETQKLVFDEMEISYAKTALKGPHNIANMLAAILCLKPFNIPQSSIKEGLSSFNALEHRLEYVCQKRGVGFINDSKATNTDSVRFALQSFEEPVHIILGGSDKGEDFRLLNPLLEKYAKGVYVIGATQEKMLKAFSGLKTAVYACAGFSEAIQTAYHNAREGEFVLLSPGCASFDMFNNFEHRGKVFKELVRNLAP